MAGFTCPFCGQVMSLNAGTIATREINFDFTSGANRGANPYLNVSIYRCPNDECRKETVIANGVRGYIENRTVFVYPETIYKQFPEYVPEAIRGDYEEACIIRKKSPKAAATLARRCLQGMIRDYWDVKDKENLYKEIDAIKERVTASQWKAIDAVRKIGNIGAHMEKDVDLIIDVEPEEAEKLLKLIELLIDKWYMAKHDEEALCNEIAGISDAKQTEKHQE